MEPLFEAKAVFNDEYAIYNIYRVGGESYKAQLIKDEDTPSDTGAPPELLMSKLNGEWQVENATYKELATTLATEIDVFNNGYGALLGRIGIR